MGCFLGEECPGLPLERLKLEVLAHLLVLLVPKRLALPHLMPEQTEPEPQGRQVLLGFLVQPLPELELLVRKVKPELLGQVRLQLQVTQPVRPQVLLAQAPQP